MVRRKYEKQTGLGWGQKHWDMKKSENIRKINLTHVPNTWEQARHWRLREDAKNWVVFWWFQWKKQKKIFFSTQIPFAYPKKSLKAFFFNFPLFPDLPNPTYHLRALVSINCKQIHSVVVRGTPFVPGIIKFLILSSSTPNLKVKEGIPILVPYW